MDANADAYAQGEKVVRYDACGATFVEPVKPYRVWCRDRLGSHLVALDDRARAGVRRIFGSDAALERLARPSPKPVENVIAALPLRAQPGAKPVDSWWRP